MSKEKEKPAQPAVDKDGLVRMVRTSNPEQEIRVKPMHVAAHIYMGYEVKEN